MPFKNFHSARQTEPEKGDKYRYVRDMYGPGKDAVIKIKPKGEEGPKGGRTEVQSVRFKKSEFSPEQSKSWLKAYDMVTSKFEKAKKEKVNEDTTMATTSVGNTTDVDGNNVGNSSIYKKKMIPKKGVLSRQGVVGDEDDKNILHDLEKKAKIRKFEESTIFDKAIMMIEDPEVKELVCKGVINVIELRFFNTDRGKIEKYLKENGYKHSYGYEHGNGLVEVQVKDHSERSKIVSALSQKGVKIFRNEGVEHGI